MTQNKKPFFHDKEKIKLLLVCIALFLGIFVGAAAVYRTLYPAMPSADVDQDPNSVTVVGPDGISTTTDATSTAIAIAASTTATLGAPSTVQVQPAQDADDIGHAVGIAGGGSLSKFSAADLNAELDSMQKLGITWVRFDIEWGDVQYSSATSSNWTSYDNLVKAIVAHHMKALGIILFTPQWARTPGCTGGVECPPSDPSLYATFASEVAARYKGEGLHYWEIWNEPNNFNFWATKVDCDAYTALLKVTYPAIKAVDPDAVIVTGGLAPESTNDVSLSPTDFLSCVYNDGGKNYFDAVGDHPYTYPNFPSSDGTGAWNQMSVTVPSLRSIMVANGDSAKKIWFTEFGTPTDGPDSHWYVSEAQQAAMVTDTFNLYKSYSWAGPLFWYTFKDSGSTTDTNENFFGLIRFDNSLKPAYTVLQKIISAGL